MQKSFIDRIFPPSSPPLPQYERRKSQTISVPTSPTPASIASSRYGSKLRQSSPLTSSKLQTPPIAASVIHHQDPLLPIDRAAKSLERRIQTLLDAQSEGLVSGLGNDRADNLSSTGSLTPTPSISTPSRKSTGPKVIPVMQPIEKPISLRQARKGLKKSMQEFMRLKSEELSVLDGQFRERDEALRQAQALEDRKAALFKEAEAIKKEDRSVAAQDARREAQELERTIHELEDKLLEMKAQHRRLLDQAGQLESIVDSKLSSYDSSIAMTDMEIRKFLRNPSIQQGLPDPVTGAVASGMYALRPERRTLEMAKEQWKSEQNSLMQRRRDVELEQRALQEGGQLWEEAVRRINAFERQLRMQMSNIAPPQLVANGAPEPEHLLTDLNNLIESLESDFSTAESKNWNLLVCALGAELEALRQGREILEGALADVSGSAGDSRTKGKGKATADVSEDTTNQTDRHSTGQDLIIYDTGVNGRLPHRAHRDSDSSNQSLEETLKEFAPGIDGRESSTTTTTGRPQVPIASSASVLSSDPPGVLDFAGNDPVNSNTGSYHAPGTLPSRTQPWRRDSRSESEDDDPGPEFLLSH